MSNDTIPSIPEYFSGKNIFITGATGFIGKVLVEKLLRSCPNVGNIYILIRPKKGKDPKERIQALIELQLFDVFKKKQPQNLSKIVPILGDVCEIGLGMSPEDKKILQESVHIIYHGAASVRFDDFLQNAIIMNTRGTLELVKLAKEMKNLEVLFHFSTTYCHTDKKVVEEKIYPAVADWREAIHLAETADPFVLQALTAKYTHPFPNTYTFTKSLGEQVVNELCHKQIPAIIFRPSIVINCILEPLCGWIDNFNGPIGLMVAGGKGVLRSLYAKSDVIADYVPCDMIVQGAIIATWRKGVEKDNREKHNISVYNGSLDRFKSVTVGESQTLGLKATSILPFNDVLWYPHITVTACPYYHYLRVIFYMLLPALLLDGLLILLGKKPLLVKIQRKIFIANNAVAYFLLNEWRFNNRNFFHLDEKLVPSDEQSFSYQKNHEFTAPDRFFGMATSGLRRYLLHEPDSTIPKAKRHMKRLWVISRIYNFLWYLGGLLLLYHILFVKINIVTKFYVYISAL